MTVNKRVDLPKGMQTRSPDDLQRLIESICDGVGFNRLKTCSENNVCHDHESVYDHTLEIVGKFSKYLDINFIGEKQLRKRVEVYFKEKIGKYSRAELFILSAFLHDVGKVETLQENINGTTSVSGHEQKSALISRKILKEKGLGDSEVFYLYNLIRLHGGFSLRFLDYLKSITDEQLIASTKRSLLLPEILLYQIADNESASSFSEYKEFILNNLLQKEELYKHNNIKRKTSKDLNKLFDEIRQKINIESKPWPEEARVIHLNEEVGEFCDIYLQVKGAKDREQSIYDIKLALNDILFELIALYDFYGLDIADSLEDELRKNE